MLRGLGAVFELLGALGLKMFDFPIIYSIHESGMMIEIGEYS